MLIEPQPASLLARICDTLEETALADMAAPYAQRQLKAGLYALRDLSVRIAAQPLWIQDDIEDMAAVLAAFGINDCETAGPGISQVQHHLRLQARIEAFEAGLFGPQVRQPATDAALRELHSLYARMLAREADARVSAPAAGTGA